MVLKLVWTSWKEMFRRPWWLLLLIFSAYVEPNPFVPEVSLGLDFEAYSGLRRVASLGDWGRALLLGLEMFQGPALFLALITALMVTGAASSEVRHREILWATRRGGSLIATLTRVLSVSLAVTVLRVTGACFVFLSPAFREHLTLAGWQFLPAYLALSWVRMALWAALTFMFFGLTRSRVGAPLIVTALQILWSSLALLLMEQGSLAQLVYRNLLVWNFTSPFAPLGLVPTAFFLQGVMGAGVVGAVLGAAHWWRLRLPEGDGVGLRVARSFTLLCLIVAVGTGIAITWELRKHVAPFSAEELWERQPELTRPYIWTKDFRLLLHPGSFMVVRLPPLAPLPRWLEEVGEGKELVRLEVGKMLVAGNQWRFQFRPQSIVMLRPLGERYPPDFERLARRTWQFLQPLLVRAQPWRKQAPEGITVLWPPDAFYDYHQKIVLLPGEIGIVPRYLQPDATWLLWEVAWALTDGMGADRFTRTYVQIFLMAGVDGEQAGQALRWLQKRSQGEEVGPLSGTQLHPKIWQPEEATRVLAHWQRGEEMGHENYIRTLVGGALR